MLARWLVIHQTPFSVTDYSGTCVLFMDTLGLIVSSLIIKVSGSVYMIIKASFETKTT